MDDFEKKEQNENQARPDYYQPNSSDNYGNDNSSQNNNTDYSAAQSEQPSYENTTYHYSYKGSEEGTNQSTSQNAYQQTQNVNQNANQSTYQQTQSANQNQNTNQYQSQNANQYQSQNGYGGNQNSGYSPYDYNNGSADNGGDNKKPAKKNKASVVIIVVLVVCLVIAGIGIILSATGALSSDNDSENTTQSDSSDSGTTLSDSEDAPLYDSDNQYTVAGVADAVMDSCVGITVYTTQSSAYNYFYGYGQSDSSSEPEESGEGSGVIMSEGDGVTYIITCAHVISDGDAFTVTLNDGTEYEATMVGYDSQTDIGVLSIEATGLQVAEFADSDNLKVGEQVVAIGCPGGLEFMNSVTSGYISALDRPISSSIGYDNVCIQTDAAINPGNSGGALFNMQGQVIGINSSKIASTEYEGMGFAVPSKTAVETADSLISVGYVAGRAKIGITYNSISSFSNASTIISALAEKGYEDADGTMVINEVDDEADLASKDIQQYDMIVAVNGETMTSTDIMTSVLSESSPGDTITLTIARIENNDINIFEVECTLIESKD